MRICFFTKRCGDGAGDVVQTVKIANFVMQLAKSRGYPTEILIVVPEKDDAFDHKQVVQHFVNEINPEIKVKTVSELRENVPENRLLYGSWISHVSLAISTERHSKHVSPSYLHARI